MAVPKKKTFLGDNAAPAGAQEPVEVGKGTEGETELKTSDDLMPETGPDYAEAYESTQAAAEAIISKAIENGKAQATMGTIAAQLEGNTVEFPAEDTAVALDAEDMPELATGSPLLLVCYTNPRSREIGYGTDGAAGIDLRAYMTGCRSRGTRLSAGSVTKFGTGVAVAIPEGYVGLVIMRSGKSANDGIQLANQVAVIDSDYRGEIMLPLTTDRTEGAFVDNGERVAQLVIVPCQQVGILKVDTLEGRNGTQKLGYLEILRPDQLEVHVTQELPETSRGTGGFGSTGSN